MTLHEHARVELDFPEVLKSLSDLSFKEVVQQCNTILTQLDTITGTRRENVELAVCAQELAGGGQRVIQCLRA